MLKAGCGSKYFVANVVVLFFHIQCSCDGLTKYHVIRDYYIGNLSGGWLFPLYIPFSLFSY